MKLTKLLIICAILCVSRYINHATSAQNTSQKVDFNRDIRPILSDKCWICHGPDAKNKKMRLRLDSEAAAKANLGGGVRAVVSGKPEESELVRRINATEAYEQMPPPSSGHQLTAREKELLTEWIKQGAAWQKHWAFIPPVKAELPAVSNRAWPRNEIDYFVLSRLEREGLTPAPEADRTTLLRRVSLDLTGLPPTPAEVDAFLHDRSPQAYEKVVDRLLASSRYGERMAFRWLDVARYADTSGYQSDRERQMWRWRDWVIDAFNRNLPYDRFVIEQLAGDLLPNATIEQRLATGFNRNHRGNSEAGIIPEEYAVEYVIDRVDTTTTAFLGLTAGCARCHNHKYDPLSQKEYYQLYAYFNSIPENGLYLRANNSPPTAPAPTKAQQNQLRRLETEIAAIEPRFASWESQIQKLQSEWERSLPPAKHWFPSDGLSVSFPLNGGDPHLPDGVVKFQSGRIDQAAMFDGKSTLRSLKTSAFSDVTPVTISVWIYPKTEEGGAVVTCAEEAEQTGDAQSAKGWIGAGYGLFVDDGKLHFNLVRNWEFDAIRVETKEKLELNRWRHIIASYDGSRTVHGTAVFVDGQKQELKHNSTSIAEPFSTVQPWRIGGAGGQKPRQFHGMIDEVRIYDAPLTPRQISILANPNSPDAIARATNHSEAEEDKLRWAFLETASPNEIRREWNRLSALKLQKARLETRFPSVMVMQEMSEPRPAFVLKRGAYDAPGESVTRGVPAALPSLPESAPNNRLGLAQWLVDPRNPLIGRVAVNRFWQMFFGVGLVKTAEDFGAQGEWPSHPELLDWLAVAFRDGIADFGMRNADLKVMVSSTNPQSATRNPQWNIKALLKKL